MSQSLSLPTRTPAGPIVCLCDRGHRQRSASAWVDRLSPFRSEGARFHNSLCKPTSDVPPPFCANFKHKVTFHHLPTDLCRHRDPARRQHQLVMSAGRPYSSTSHSELRLGHRSNGGPNRWREGHEGRREGWESWLLRLSIRQADTYSCAETASRCAP